MPGEIFGCHKMCMWVGVATCGQWGEARAVANRPTMCRMSSPQTKNYLAKNVKSAKVVKPSTYLRNPSFNNFYLVAHPTPTTTFLSVEWVTFHPRKQGEISREQKSRAEQRDLPTSGSPGNMAC